MAKRMVKRKDGSYRIYYELRANFWEKERGAVRQVYAGYLGSKPVISEAKAERLARQISQRLGREITVDDLRKVKRLKIITNAMREGEN